MPYVMSCHMSMIYFIWEIYMDFLKIIGIYSAQEVPMVFKMVLII